MYVPDASPGEFSLTDPMRWLFLLFSFMAFGFALLMLVVRYKGVDIATGFIPHSGWVLWLGKHAYEYSQPQVTLRCYTTTTDAIALTISHQGKEHVVKASAQAQDVPLGVVKENPRVEWQNSTGQAQSQVLDLMSDLKKFGRNVRFDLKISPNHCEFKKKA